MMRFRPVAFLATLVLVVSACTGATPSATTAPAATGAGQTAAATTGASGPAVKEGGSIVVALPGDISSTDTAFISDSNSSTVANQVIETLVTTKPGTNSDLAPGLAKSWTSSADGLTYTFELQSGVKFSDGTDFNADAVCFNYNRWNNFTGALASPDYSYYYGAVFGGYGKDSNLDSCTATNPGEVVIKLKKPYVAFLLSQTISTFGINSPKALKDGDADNADPTKAPYGHGGAGAMTGTGPFMFKEWVPNDHVTIVKNPNYWNKDGAAHLDQITFKGISDTTAALNAIQAGDVDFVQIGNPTDIPTVQGDSKLQVISRGESCNLFHLGMNETHKPFDNPKIRQAVGYAINRQNLVDTFYGGNSNATVAKSWMPPTFPGFKDESGTIPQYDVQKAKDAIAASGVPQSELTFDFWYPSNVFRPYLPDPKGIFQAISNDLEAAGFKINPQTKPWHEGYLKDESVGKYPMWEIGWTCDWGSADNFLDTAFFYYSGGKPNPEFAYKNDAVNALFKQAEAQTQESAADPIWAQAQDQIATDLQTLPIVNSKPVAFASSAMQGFVGSGNLTELFNTVWLNK